MSLVQTDLYEINQEETNGDTWSVGKCWECAIQQYGLPIVQYCISALYVVYAYCTPLNVALFIVKTVPSAMFVFNFVKRIYVTSRERIKQKQVELENLQLQFQIVNTKLSVRDAEFTERALELQRGTAKLRCVRAKVREVIAADEEIRRSLNETVPWEDDSDTRIDSPEGELGDTDVWTNATPPEHSEYSSASDGDTKQNCRVKIVKVTNVYKVAYLKHYIKQKRLRRDTRHAILKKKMENVKKLLDDWQTMLSMVINRKLSFLTMDSQYMEIASQEAMGDYTKQDFRESSDSDSDFRNFNDNYYDEPDYTWVQNTHRNFPSNFEDTTDTAVSNDITEQQYDNYCDGYKYSQSSPRSESLLFTLPEETSSQVAIEEING